MDIGGATGVLVYRMPGSGITILECPADLTAEPEELLASIGEIADRAMELTTSKPT